MPRTPTRGAVRFYDRTKKFYFCHIALTADRYFSDCNVICPSLFDRINSDGNEIKPSPYGNWTYKDASGDMLPTVIRSALLLLFPGFLFV
ncbi:hypothetical protein NX059_003196 [Plenodomus lindquistii]|nr:hypothetical protein NX059_003196 [Plenodomus lindquistii]